MKLLNRILTIKALSIIPEGHIHDEYALVDHDHDDKYSVTAHTHNDYALTAHEHQGYALTAHTHNDYALTAHEHQGYALTAHTHNDYALTAHEHQGYALTAHTHNDYALTAHEHQGYALTAHTHNDYALTNHNHNSEAIEGISAKFGNVAGGNYMEVESDGTIRFHGTATVWKDIDFPIIIRNTGTGIPSLVDVQDGLTLPQWQVNDTNMLDGKEFSHPWKEGSTIRWHLHMITNGVDVTDRYVKFEVKWMWANPDSQLSSTITQSYEYTIPANTPTKTHLLVPIYQWTPVGGRIAGHVYPRLTRITSSGAAPTNDPFVTMLQMHIECDTVGSREYQTK
jgi:hypothetical protein